MNVQINSGVLCKKCKETSKKIEEVKTEIATQESSIADMTSKKENTEKSIKELKEKIQETEKQIQKSTESYELLAQMAMNK